MLTNLVISRDNVADLLDDMASLGEHWKRNRDRGRMPNGIRSAMLLVAREVIMTTDMEARADEIARQQAGQPQE